MTHPEAHLSALSGIPHLRHAPADVRRRVRVVLLNDGDRHPGVAAHVARLDAALRRVHQDAVALNVYPNGRDLWRAVGHQGGYVGVILLL